MSCRKCFGRNISGTKLKFEAWTRQLDGTISTSHSKRWNRLLNLIENCQQMRSSEKKSWVNRNYLFILSFIFCDVIYYYFKYKFSFDHFTFIIFAIQSFDTSLTHIRMWNVQFIFYSLQISNMAPICSARVPLLQTIREILERFFAREVLMQFTAVKESGSKSVFKKTDFFICLQGNLVIIILVYTDTKN